MNRANFGHGSTNKVKLEMEAVESHATAEELENKEQYPYQ